MAGVGKLLKQAQKMQKAMEAVQTELANTTVEGSAAGGAVKADLKDSLQHTDRCFVLFDNKASRICKVGIIFRSG